MVAESFENQQIFCLTFEIWVKSAALRIIH